MGSEQCESDFRSDTAHLEQRRKETLLIATGESDQHLALFAHEMMQEQLDLSPFRKRVHQLGQHANPQPETVAPHDDGVVLDPCHRPGDVGVHRYPRSPRNALRTARS